MANPHVIRLRGPWEFLPLRTSAGGDLPAGGKTTVPGDWTEALGADFRGVVRYTRPFNCPTNLDAGERVNLICEGVDDRAHFTLNDQPLGETRGAAGAVSWDITQLLKLRNLLVVDVELPDDDATRPATRRGQGGGIVGEVRLEIG